MSRLKKFSLILFLVASTSATGLAQNQQSGQNDAEKLKIELAERARQEAEQRDWEAKIFQIKYVDPNELRVALSMFRSAINYSGGNLRILSVRAPKEIMPAIEDAIKRLDVPTPRKEAELTAYIVMASDQPDTGTLPSNLQPVINELKKILAYKGFQLLDTVIARGGDGRDVNLQGALPPIPALATPPNNILYRLSGRLAVNSDGKAPVLRISNLQFVLSMPPGQVSIGTDVEIPQGQQVVVGKGTFLDKAFILVMSARFPN